MLWVWYAGRVGCHPPTCPTIHPIRVLPLHAHSNHHPPVQQLVPVGIAGGPVIIRAAPKLRTAHRRPKDAAVGRHRVSQGGGSALISEEAQHHQGHALQLHLQQGGWGEEGRGGREGGSLDPPGRHTATTPAPGGKEGRRRGWQARSVAEWEVSGKGGEQKREVHSAWGCALQLHLQKGKEGRRGAGWERCREGGMERRGGGQVSASWCAPYTPACSTQVGKRKCTDAGTQHGELSWEGGSLH